MNADAHLHRHIVIVGPCAAGKSTLRTLLQARGYTQVRVVAQEHSGIRDLWKLRGYPDVLIYLDTEPETANARQGRSDWTLAEHLKQIERLREAGIENVERILELGEEKLKEIPVCDNAYWFPVFYNNYTAYANPLHLADCPLNCVFRRRCDYHRRRQVHCRQAVQINLVPERF